MSDLLKKFKSVFIVDDPAEATPAETTDASIPVQPPVVSSAPPSPLPSGAVSDKFIDILMAALEKNNQPGFDYFEYRQALKNLEKMSMDEQTRFQSAYAMAQTMGATPQKLAESAQFYLGILGNEQSKFNDAHAQQRSKLIGTREDELKNLDSMIVQKTKQIEELTQEIEAHRQNSEQIKTEISDSTVKIEGTKADFDATFANVIANIQSDVSKIQQYLK
jgi:hypothetical protein